MRADRDQQGSSLTGRASDTGSNARNGRSGAYNGQGRPNPAATTAYGAPVHTVQSGPYAGISAAKSPAAWAALNDQVNTYNAAAGKWNASAQTPSLANLVNAFAPMGLSMQPPEYGKPKTYVGGDYHLGLNPADLAGGLLGGMAFPGVGMITGPLAGAAYTKFGGDNLMLGGGQVPSSWAINNQGGPSSGQGTPQPGTQGRQSSAADHLNNLANLNAGVSGNSSAPVSSGTATPPGAPPGPQYAQMLASTQSIYPGYNVQLPSYQYLKRATV